MVAHLIVDQVEGVRSSYTSPNNYIVKNCRHCDAQFSTKRSDHNRGRGVFCTISCASKNRKRKLTGEIVACSLCNTSFYIKRSRVGKSKNYFCSNEHRDKYYTKNTIYTYRKNTLKIVSNACVKCGYDLYPEILQVHHIDENRKNNVSTNLQVLCPNCHAIEHHIRRRKP